jgi:hypothetical protein
MRTRSFLVLLALIGSVPLAGCEQRNSLTGAVTYNGDPVEKGAISFQPAGGAGTGFGATIVDGKYTVDKVLPGQYIASIRGVHVKLAPQSTEEAIKQYEAAKAAGKATLDHYGQPADYIAEDAEGNSKTVDIESGSDTLNFALKGPPRSR